jgi:hypothetical protein
MLRPSDNALLGFIELQVGSQAVKVPVRAAKPHTAGDPTIPLASFATEGNAYAIYVRRGSDTSSPVVEKAVEEAAEEALVHLSRKLLN